MTGLKRRRFAAFDASTCETTVVPDTELPVVAFCNSARLAWALLREVLALPPVDPLFDWTEYHPDRGVRIGDHVTVGTRHVLLTHQQHVELWPGDNAPVSLREWADVVAADRAEVFGALPMPLGMYYAVRVHAPADSLSIRVLHTYLVCPPPHHDPGWVTRFDVVFARRQA